MGVVALFHELIRLGGRGGTNVFQNKHWGYLGWGFDWKQRFLLQKFRPMTNPLTLSKGFFMKIFNEFDRKIGDVWRCWGGFFYGWFRDHHLRHFGYLSI